MLVFMLVATLVLVFALLLVLTMLVLTILIEQLMIGSRLGSNTQCAFQVLLRDEQWSLRLRWRWFLGFFQ
jgi:hypothetical protein